MANNLSELQKGYVKQRLFPFFNYKKYLLINAVVKIFVIKWRDYNNPANPMVTNIKKIDHCFFSFLQFIPV